MDDKFTLDAKKVKRDKRLLKIAKLSLVILILAILFSYMVIGFIYNSGNFTITLDENLYYDRGIIMYDDPYDKTFRQELLAESIDAFDNISETWLPDNLDDNTGGSNNGDNYISYSFYVENIGDQVSDYYSEILVEDVIKNVDEAVRIKVYKNGEALTYAKENSSGNPEEGTIAFESDELVVFDHVEDFKPGDIVKYTLVVWLEGTDIDCTNNLIGGEIKLQMKFNSELVEK